jgi:hypothetical protein
MLWSTPSIGAETYIYRINGSGFSLLAKFRGDRVTVGDGTVTALSKTEDGVGVARSRTSTASSTADTS